MADPAPCSQATFGAADGDPEVAEARPGGAVNLVKAGEGRPEQGGRESSAEATKAGQPQDAEDPRRLKKSRVQGRPAAGEK